MLLVLLLTQLTFLIHRQEPQPSALVILRELADIHGHARLIVNQRQEISNLLDGQSLLLRGVRLRKKFVSHPKNEVRLLRAVEDIGVFEERVRILLLVVVRVRDFLDAHRHSGLHSECASLHNHLNAMPVWFSVLGWVSIRKETHLACDALDCREMRFIPRRSERSHRIVYADRL